MEIPCGIHTQISQEGVVWAGAARTGAAEGIGGDRGSLDGGSRAHVGVDCAEVFGGLSDGVCERQERDSHRAGLCGAVAELCRPAFLGSRVLGIDGGEERGGGAPIHPTAGEGRPTFGSTNADAALSGSRNN